MPIKIMLVDDHALFRKGIHALIGQNPTFEVVAEASSGEEAVALYIKTHPDVVLMDMRLPGEDGIGTTGRILGIDSDAKIIMLSAFDFDTQVVESIRRGARGFLSKDLDPDVLFGSIESVYRGGIALSTPQLAKLLESSQTPAATPQGEHLSARESEVLSLVAKGLTNREVAEQLVISPSTVKAHIGNIMSKLGLHNRVSLASYALSHDLG